MVAGMSVCLQPCIRVSVGLLRAVACGVQELGLWHSRLDLGRLNFGAVGLSMKWDDTNVPVAHVC